QNGSAHGYLFILDLGGGNYITADSPRLRVERTAYVAAMYKEIEDRWLSSKSDFDAFTAELRAYGGGLFESLFPLNLQQALWSARGSLKAIHVYSEEPFIPWELVHLKPPAQDGPQRLPADMHFLGQ